MHKDRVRAIARTRVKQYVPLYSSVAYANLLSAPRAYLSVIDTHVSIQSMFFQDIWIRSWLLELEDRGQWQVPQSATLMLFELFIVNSRYNQSADSFLSYEIHSERFRSANYILSHIRSRSSAAVKRNSHLTIKQKLTFLLPCESIKSSSPMTVSLLFKLAMR